MKNNYEIVDLFHVYETDDGGMGRDVGLIGYFTDADAAAAARAGENHPYTGSRQVPALRIGNVYFRLAEAEPIEVNVPPSKMKTEQLKKSGMAKLSAAERKALGL